MVLKRVIPCLDVDSGRVFKGTNFVGLRDAGDPVELAERYDAEGADELTFLDVSASADNRATMLDVVTHTAEQVFVPLTVGGGVRTIEDFQKLFDAGASKVSVNSAAVARPALIAEASARFGKERVVVAIDAGNIEGRFQVLTNGGEVNTGKDLVAWARECEALGAGAILLTSIDADGAQTGYDIPMTRAVTESVGIPVIASGGCGAVEDIIQVFQETDCAAALAASLFHYGRATIAQVKREMERSGIPCL